VALRYFNVFGPRQDPGSQYAAAVPIFISRACLGEPLTIFGDGEQTRDFIYVKDIVAANVHAATRPDMRGVYNVAYGGQMTINDLARRIIALVGSTSEIQYAPERAGDVKHSSASVERLRETGFVPGHDFGAGLGETVAYFKQAGASRR
jgi:UDP-glucose 4-epimerase